MDLIYTKESDTYVGCVNPSSAQIRTELYRSLEQRQIISLGSGGIQHNDVVTSVRSC